MGVGRRAVVAWAAVALSLGAAPAGADYLQVGYDAAKTHAVPYAGPAEPEVAWVTQLPGSRASFSWPIVLGGDVYALTSDQGFEGLDTNGLFRLDGETGAATLVAAFDETPVTHVTDGLHLYVALQTKAVALAPDGAVLWEWPFPDLLKGPQAYSICPPGSLDAGALYLSCSEFGVEPPTGNQPGASDDYSEVAYFVVAIDTASGEARWTWKPTASDSLLVSRSPSPAPADVQPSPASGTFGVVAIGGRAYVSVLDAVSPPALDGDAAETPGYANPTLWALDAATGRPLWVHRPETTNTLAYAQRAEVANLTIVNAPTGDADGTYVLAGGLAKLRPSDGRVVWRRSLGANDQLGGIGSFYGLAFTGDRLYAMSPQTVYSFDPSSEDAPEPLWSLAADKAASERWTAIWRTQDGLLARSILDAPVVTTYRLVSIDAETGARRWHLEFTDPTGSERRIVNSTTAVSLFSYSLDDDRVVVAGRDGTVRMVGRTSASLVPSLDVSTEYPAPGEAVRVDLSATRAGLHGPATEYRAEWGDGSATEWQSSPAFAHAYAAPGDVAARFFARNDAGQTSAETVVFHVGAPEPNVLSAAFAPENQERTFFALGLAVTGAAGAFGIVRHRAKKGALRRELSAVEEGFARTRERPRECEDFLAERRTRANALLVDGRLDEAQYAVLKGRVEELARDLRLGLLDRELGFLPLSTARALQEILSDGRVTRWEREHFLAAVERDPVLTPELKQRVRARLDEWFARDAGEGAR